MLVSMILKTSFNSFLTNDGLKIVTALLTNS